MIKKIKNIFNSIKNFFNKLLDVATLKAENKLLHQQLEDEKKKHQPLIDLKNRYLAELRIAKMQVAKYKKKSENLEEELQKINEFYKAKEIEILGDKK